MTQVLKDGVGTYFRKFLKIGITLLIPVLASFTIWDFGSALALMLAYLLSFLFVASNYLVIRNIDIERQKKFLTIFFTSLAVRFILVLSAFILVLLLIKIDQIIFTVSFIISYILHSVIEVIFINKILEFDKNNR